MAATFLSRSPGASVSVLLMPLTLWLSSAAAGPFAVQEVDLVTSDPIAHAAQLSDSTLKNAWGISYSSTGGPFWVSANGSGVALLYVVNASDQVSKVVNLPQVQIPPVGSGKPTGQVFNPNMPPSFNGDIFLFVSEGGTISGWRSALGMTAEVLQLGSSANVYKGTTLDIVGGNEYLASANFRAGTIDILRGDAGAPDLLGNFTDPNLPSGYAPFNIQELGGQLYVAYAVQDADKLDDSPGVGNGIVDVFNLDGSFATRVATGGTLNSPWGLALAPTSFGPFAGDLLVGNFGDGRINVFDPAHNFLGQIDAGGGPLSIEGLWALTVGGGGSNGSANEIYFTAGPDDESNGLFGALRFAGSVGSVPEPGTLPLLCASLLAALALARRPRKLPK